MIDAGGLTLHEILNRLGYTIKPAGNFWGTYSKKIMKGDAIAFTGDSTEVWAWLRSSGQIK